MKLNQEYNTLKTGLILHKVPLGPKKKKNAGIPTDTVEKQEEGQTLRPKTNMVLKR